jgi:protein phosphatase
MIEFAAATHPGLKRSNNEDCYEADPARSLWLVADGVGGHADGEVASRLVAETIKSCFSSGSSLTQSVHSAHQAVLSEIAQRGSGANMGSTVVALAIEDNGYSLVWVGDSRAYLWNGRTLNQLTRDHTRIARLMEQGVVTFKEARTHPARHVLTQSLGVSPNMAIKPEQVGGKLGEGNQILLCSDGLTDELDDREIAEVLQSHRSAQSRVDALVRAAIEAGGSDNITAVLVGRESDKTCDDQGKARDSSAFDESGRQRKSWLKTAFLAVLATLLVVALTWTFTG